jgi:hypothetical protein
MAIKVTPSDRSQRAEVKVKTKQERDKTPQAFNWWKAKSKAELAQQIVETASFLKEQQQYRFRQASVHARMYGNQALANFAGSSFNRLGQTNNLPVDRPTMNVVQSCVDTLTSRISQSRPRPIFLTDNSNYKERTLAKQLNNFIAGELYCTKSYEIGPMLLRDAAILGTGCLKVFESDEARVAVERTLVTELFVDSNDAFYGKPRSLYQLKLVERSVLMELFPEYRSEVQKAEQAYPDNSGETQKTVSDQVMVVEAWHLPSSSKATDGRHTIACTAGILLDEEYKKDDFPFVFLHYSPRLVGLWGQGLAEQLTGTQVEINKLLSTISQSISLVGVPRVFVEDGSKVVKAQLNNQVGSIVTYRGTKPEYEVAPSVHPELYQQLQRLIDYAYQQSGISALAATSQKPAGLNSGEALRNYDDLQSDRFAVLNKRYDQIFIDLAYKIIDLAKDIAERDGKYSTVYPNKDGAREVDLPKAEVLDYDYVIQCYDSSSLPRDPAGRLQKITEMMQAGIIDPQEGRRLLDFPDLQQVDKLATAAQERIYKVLDDIIESGKFEPPDPYTDIQLGKKIVSQYYNLYASCGLEESKLELLRNWQSQLLQLEQMAMPPAPMGAPGGVMASPEALPTNPMIPNVPQAQ